MKSVILHNVVELMMNLFFSKWFVFQLQSVASQYCMDGIVSIICDVFFHL